MKDTNQLLRVAIHYATKKGFLVHPLKPGTKVPLTRWKEAASRDPDQIVKWWTQWPDANIGLVTGKESLVVLDVDVKHGQLGMKSLAEIFSAEDLDKPIRVRTPSGGLHLYFTSDKPLGNPVGFMPGLDFRADGGYIVAPPSRTEEGAYRFENARGGRLYPIPKQLLERLMKAGSRAGAEKAVFGGGDVIEEGGRNDTLFREACRLRNKRLQKDEVLDRLLLINEQKCDPPLEQDEVERIVASALSRSPDVVEYLLSFPTTEKGISEILLDRFGGEVIYVPELSQFATYDGFVWAMDEGLEMERRVKMVTDLYQEGLQILNGRLKEARENDNEQGIENLKKLVDVFKAMHRNTGKKSTMNSLLHLFRSEVVVRLCGLDRDPFKFAVLNGVIDLRTGTIAEEVNPEEYITMRGLVHYDRDANCPIWDEFLLQCMDGDQEMVKYLQKLVGYCLTGSVSEQKLFFLYGAGANGKSTFMNVIQRLIGDYYRSVPASVLMAQKNGGGQGPTPALAMLRGKRLAVASELEEGERLSEPLVKMLTGGDPIPARHLYGEYFEVDPKFSLIMVGNHRPRVHGADEGIWRRIHLIHFRNVVPPEQRDPELQGKLMEELPGILNWALEGAKAWQASGLGSPDRVRSETDEYRREQDIVGTFISDCCRVDQEEEASLKELFEAYSGWAVEGNEWCMRRRDFSRRLEEKGFQKYRRNSGFWFRGLRASGGLYRPPIRTIGHDDEGEEGREYRM